MKFKTLIFSLGILIVIALGFFYTSDPDTFWHLRTGQIIVEERMIIQSDPFSFQFENKEWLYPALNWLSEVQMWLVYDLFGFSGLNVWVVLIAVISMTFIYFSMSGHPILRIFLIALSVITARIYWKARPHIFSFLFTAIFVWILESYRNRKSNKLWLLPILMLLWVNSHSGYILGILLFGIYIFGISIEKLWAKHNWDKDKIWINIKKLPIYIFEQEFMYQFLILVLILFAVLINPIGYKAYTFPGQSLSIDVLRNLIKEWQSPNFHEIGFHPFLWMILLLFVSIVVSSRKIKFTEFLLIVVFGFMGFYAVRNIYLFALISAPIISHLLTPNFDKFTNSIKDFGSGDEIRKPIHLLLFIVAVIAVFVQIYPFLVEQNNLDFFAEEMPLPVEASKQLMPISSNYRILNSYNFGGYLSFYLPAQKIFVDGRTDLYENEFLEDWVAMVNAGENWKDKFEQWDFNFVMLEPFYPLTTVLQYEGWKVLYEDEKAVILIQGQ